MNATIVEFHFITATCFCSLFHSTCLSCECRPCAKEYCKYTKVEVNYEEFSVFSVDENISLSIGCR